MKHSSTHRLKTLGVFTTSQAEKLGLSRPALSKLVQEGELQRLSRGIYIHSKAKVSHDISYRIACIKFGPQAVIGGLSALFHYQLIEQVPQQTWVLVPPECRTKEKQYRLIRTASSLERGVAVRNGYKIVTVERALVEGLRFASKIGDRTAIGAVRKAFAQRLTNEGKLGRMAHELGQLAAVQRFIEAIIA